MIDLWLTILVAGLVTYGIRLSLIAAHKHLQLPRWFRRALTFVPVAVLSALIFPELLVANGTLDISMGNPRILAGILAALTAWWTKNVTLTIVLGMAALFLIQAVIVK